MVLFSNPFLRLVQNFNRYAIYNQCTTVDGFWNPAAVDALSSLSHSLWRVWYIQTVVTPPDFGTINSMVEVSKFNHRFYQLVLPGPGLSIEITVRLQVIFFQISKPWPDFRRFHSLHCRAYHHWKACRPPFWPFTVYLLERYCEAHDPPYLKRKHRRMPSMHITSLTRVFPNSLQKGWFFTKPNMSPHRYFEAQPSLHRHPEG